MSVFGKDCGSKKIQARDISKRLSELILQHPVSTESPIVPPLVLYTLMSSPLHVEGGDVMWSIC